MGKNIEKLQGLSRQLEDLMKDPQPGLGAWSETLYRVLQAMAPFIPTYKVVEGAFSEALRLDAITRDEEVACILREAANEIDSLNRWITDMQAGCYINCVYCGHRYGPDDGNHLVTMQDALKSHIKVCPKHPMAELEKEVRETWSAARSASGQAAAFRILERMVDRIGYGRIGNNPSLVTEK